MVDCGLLIFDALHPELNHLLRDKHHQYDHDEFIVKKTGQKVTVYENSEYDRKTQTSSVDYYYTAENGETKVLSIKNHFFFPQELDYIVFKSDFDVLRKLGTYTGEEFTASSKEQIYILRKKRKVYKMAELGFGLMRLPLLDTADKSSVDIETTREMLRQYIASGFRYFDCGFYYHGGQSESIFGEYVAAEYDRENLIITSKLPVSHLREQSECEEVFKKQLQRCRISYFDYYLLHGIGRKVYPKLKDLKAFEFLSEQKKLGLTHKIGFSFHDNADVLETILAKHPEIDVVQLQINFLDWQDSGVQAQRCYEICEKYNKEVLVMEHLKGGTLVMLSPELRNFYESRNGVSLV